MRALLAILCALALSAAVFSCLEQLKRLNTLSIMHLGSKEAIVEGKQTINKLLVKINSFANANPSARLSIASAVIRDFNATGARVFSFNQAGVFNNHFNPIYLGRNAYFIKDAKGQLYMSKLDLINHSSAYVIANVQLANKVHQVATYVMKDPQLDLYYGCVVDLGKIMQSASFDKLSRSHIQLAVYALYACALAALLWLYRNSRRLKLG